MATWKRLYGITFLGCSLALALPSSARAYDSGVHFYLTYVLAYWCGLDSFPSVYDEEGRASQVDEIAWADMNVDTFPETDAGADPHEWLDPSKIGTRRHFHFPIRRGSGKSVIRSSLYAWQTIEAAVDEGAEDNPNALLLGIGIHTLQDSFSHEGFGPRFGHWHIAPDLPKTDVPKALEMAEATWIGLDRWARKVHGMGCEVTFTDVSGLLETWLSVPLGSEKSLMAFWRMNVEAAARRPISDDLLNGASNIDQDFLAAAAHVVWLKDGPNEDQRAELPHSFEPESLDAARR